MRCEAIMKRNIECILPQETVQDAARRMRDANVGFLPVCDEAKQVLGTVTDRDLAIRVLADARAATTAIRDVITDEVIACSPEDDLGKAQALMAQNHESRIMCLDDEGGLVGIISLSDIAEYDDWTEASETLRKISEREARA